MKLILVFLYFLTIKLEAITYSAALEKIQEHEIIQAGDFKVKVVKEVAKNKLSWEDPVLKIAAKNYPVDTFSNNQSPMTGIEIGVSQKVPLTNKYNVMHDRFENLSQAYEYSVENKKELLSLNFWKILIEKRKISNELTILRSNKEWIEKNLKVSKRLYTIAKTSQQAILEIQMRLSEINNIISNKKYELVQIKEQLIYLTGESDVDEDSIPWNSLKISSGKTKDYRALEFQERIKAKENKVKASNLEFISDLTVSLNYTQRSNIDMVEDFVGASVSFPLAVFDKKYSSYSSSLHEKSQTLQEYEVYKRSKTRDISLKMEEINKISSELDVIDSEIIGFASDARKIISKSYGVGKASYIELLQSELNLQNILLRKVFLESKRDIERVTLKYIKGELLNE